MPNTKNLKPDLNRLRFCIYGPAGSGKTHAIQTFPKPYVFDADGGILTIAGADVEYDIYDDPNPSKKAEAWREIIKKTYGFIKECPFETIVYDSITTISELMMNEVQRVNGTLGQQPNIREWGIQIDTFIDFLRILKNIPANVVCIGHDQLLQDETTGEIYVVPLVPGKKLPRRMPAYFDEVYYTEVSQDRKTKETVYQVMTQSSKKVQAKSRLKGLDTFEELDYQKMMAKVKPFYE